MSPPAEAQDILISGVVITDDDTAAQIESAIAVVEARLGLDAETRIDVVDQLLTAKAHLENKLAADATAVQYAAALDNAPAETDSLRVVLDELPPAPATIESLGIDDSASLAELQQWLAKETAELTALDSQLAEFKAQIETQAGRPAVVRERIEQQQRNRDSTLIAEPERFAAAVGKQLSQLSASAGRSRYRTKSATGFGRGVRGFSQ